jgi:hypothetical protein
MTGRLAGPALLLCGAALLLAAASPSPLWPASPADSADPATFPESAMILRAAIGDAIQRGDGPAVENDARALAAMGGALSIASQARIAAFLDPHEAEALERRFADNVEPLALSTLETEVPAEYRIVEGLAYDPATARLFAGSVVDGRLLVRGRDRAWRAVSLDGPVGGLFGMAVDAKRRRLWLTSGAAEQVADPAHLFRGLIAVDLDRLAVVRRVPLPPEAGSPGDLVVAADGTVYVSNAENGAIHVCAPGCDRLADLVPPGRFRNPQGLALSRDGRRLYVADYGYGLAVIDLRKGGIARVAARGPAMLDGIDGLVGWHGDLIAIQNGTNPRRIVRLRLGSKGRVVRSIEVLECANPDWGEPTLATVAGNRLLFVADGQWERFAARGAPVGREPPRVTPIRALVLAR